MNACMQAKRCIASPGDVSFRSDINMVLDTGSRLHSLASQKRDVSIAPDPQGNVPELLLKYVMLTTYLTEVS
jgi:hypothetical protein